jgi:hypothetical protein
MDAFARVEIEGEQIASGLVPSDQIRGDDEIDTALLREMAENAKSYITSFSWCETVLDWYFCGGFGGIFAIFFFHIRPNRPGIDPWIWILLGDVPAAYLPLTDCRSPEEAFRKYFIAMSKWVDLAGKDELARQIKAFLQCKSLQPLNGRK